MTIAATLPDTPDEVAATTLLARLAGDGAELREDQWEAIAALLARRRVMLVQRTGWGKSAVYWIATALRRRAGAGPTLVISPLLALMRDQVAAAERLGLAAATINSSNADAWQQITEQLDRDEIDVLLISPERLNSPAFLPHLNELAPRIGLLVVDEAHCISDWGHDFRPDYRRITTLLDDLAPSTPVLACTATANERVTADVATQLGTDVVTLRGQLGRDSLRLAVLNLPSSQRRLAWLVSFVRQHRPIHGRAGVIYTLTVDDTERTATFLRSQGIDAVAYNSNVSTEERQQIEDDLLANRVDVVVSTSALGMGYDKPDLAFVVHLGAPSSPVAYYQQVGRAGRAIDHAEVVLLPTSKDEAIWRHFDLAGIPTRDEVERILVALDDGGPTTVQALERRVNLRRSRLALLLKVLDVDGAVTRDGSSWLATGSGWDDDEDRNRHLADQRRGEHAMMRRLRDGDVDGCLMTFLAAALDDRDTVACGRCQGCVDWEPDVAEDQTVVAAARDFLQTRDVVLRPRRQWPSGLTEVKGRLKPGRAPVEGRALAGGDDSGWSDQVSALIASPDDEERLEQVVQGLTKVLARWNWQTRPTSIVPMPSRTHGELALRLATRLGALGRLPVIEALSRADGPSQRQMSNSPYQAANALRRLTATPAVADIPAGAVLLLDVTTDSGWSLVAASHRLTEETERAILPLVLTSGP